MFITARSAAGLSLQATRSALELGDLTCSPGKEEDNSCKVQLTTTTTIMVVNIIIVGVLEAD